jgi:hypothetical protein
MILTGKRTKGKPQYVKEIFRTFVKVFRTLNKPCLFALHGLK